MSVNPLLDVLDVLDETPETTEETKAVAIRPTVDLPSSIRMLKTSYWPASTKPAQYGGWSPELKMYVRTFGRLAEEMFNAYGATLVGGEPTGERVSLVLTTANAANGLLFLAQSEEQRDFVSLNEYSISEVDVWKPRVIFHNRKA